MAPRPLVVLLLLLLPAPAGARDLEPRIERLANGLTVMILEDHTQPVVSTQVLYRVGGRSEGPGETGIAHFVEHMAYRATALFPDTQVVSRIYAAGGEWHGYTWIDETTYFATVPADRLDLVLAIEADRMARLLLPAGEVEAERGAVLTEMHGYENDPASRLNDAVIAASFVEHPYRNNVIGWESDVERISRDDLAAFYHRHYAPANAILAVAGDVDGGKVLALIHQDFDALPAGERTPLPRTVEPPQTGERRVDLPGGGAQAYFQISYRAPAASDPDYPAFLLLQAVLSGSPGANFHQDEEPFPARPGSRLAGLGTGLRTFFAPTALPYVFSLGGTAGADMPPARIEEEIEKRIAVLRDQPVPADELAAARRALLDALELDTETSQDAAHQMAFFEGIGAFPVLRRLPELIAAVTSEELRKVVASRLRPGQRTIGWIHPGPPGAPAAPIPVLTPPPPAPRAVGPAQPASPEASRRAPAVRTLRNGIGLIVRRLPRIPAGILRVVVPADGTAFAAGDGAVEIRPDEPSWRHTSIEVRFRAGELPQAVERARQALAGAKPAPPADPAQSEDPEERLRSALRDLVGAVRSVPIPPAAGPPTPPVVVVVGDLGGLDETAALRLLEKAFGGLPARRPLPPVALHVDKAEEAISLPGPAESELGYGVPAGSPAAAAADAWPILLYVMSHGYEGRLGKELIAHLGLLYAIDSRLVSDGRSAWIALTAGVTPDKLDAARAHFAGLLEQLRQEPPTDAEIAEAKQALTGRRLTAPKGDAEISAAYAREWIEQGRLLTGAEYGRRLRAVTREQVLALVPRFLAGATVVVDVRSVTR